MDVFGGFFQQLLDCSVGELHGLERNRFVSGYPVVTHFRLTVYVVFRTPSGARRLVEQTRFGGAIGSVEGSEGVDFD